MTLFSSKRLHTLLLLVSFCLSSNSFAQSQPLLILEDISGVKHSLTREDLEALPQTQFTTTTPWTKGAHTYQGPKLTLVTDKLSSSLSAIRAFAINGYAFEISASDLKKYPYILAMKQDGKELTLRNKGPLWILLSFDQNPELNDEQTVLNQSVWQVGRIKAL